MGFIFVQDCMQGTSGKEFVAKCIWDMCQHLIRHLNIHWSTLQTISTGWIDFFFVHSMFV